MVSDQLFVKANQFMGNLWALTREKQTGFI